MAKYDPDADLVERLRIAAERGDVVRAILAKTLLLEAAEEISRLRQGPTRPDMDAIAEVDPEILLADGLEEAYIGVTINTHHKHVAVYDYEKCIKALMKRGLSCEDADEYLEFNTVCAYVGEYSPLYVSAIGVVAAGEPEAPAGDRAAAGDAGEGGVAV
jgi:hypothetical protein